MDEPSIIISDYLDGELATKHQGEFVTWILQTSENRKQFVATCYFHSQLLDIFSKERLTHRTDDLPAYSAESLVIDNAALFAPVTDLASLNGPSFNFLGNTLHSTLGYLSSDWLVSYLVAVVIFGVGALFTSHIYVSPPEQIVDNSPSIAPAVSAVVLPERQLVGRVTGLVDCHWSDAHTAVRLGRRVAASDEFVLASGLVEITYDTGAKVLLQGPVTYHVDSPRGGFLSVGKLTARVEKKEVSNQKSNPQSPIPNPPLFVVRTPTAIITDLGTEFGVEVRPNCQQDVVVFQGRVRVGLCEGRGDGNTARILRAGQAAKIDALPTTVVVSEMPTETRNQFIREIRTPMPLPTTAVINGASLVLWLKADAIKNVKDRTPVGMWPDSSDRHNDMYHATENLPIYISGASSGLNGMPVVRFSGDQQLCGTLATNNSRIDPIRTLSTPCTMFSVVRNSDVDDQAIRGYFGGGNRRIAFGISRHPTLNPKNSFWAWTPDGLSTYGQADSLSTRWNVHAYVLPDMTQRHWIWYRNGKATGDVGLSAETPKPYGETVYVGGTGWQSEYWIGDVAELILYGRVLTDVELGQVGRYLARKYGIDTCWTALNSGQNVENASNTASKKEEVPMNVQQQ
jgi:hypothetical protein